MAKETDGTKNDWLNFIRQHHIGDWANVYYSKAAEKARVDAGVPRLFSTVRCAEFSYIIFVRQRQADCCKEIEL